MSVIREKFEIFENLMKEDKVNIEEIIIINAIKVADEKFTPEIEEELFKIINKAVDCDQTNTHPASIADEIIEAYSNGEISLEALKNADSYKVLDCAIGMSSFEAVEEDYNMEEENDG